MVDEWCEAVHDENGKRHAFRIATPVADNDSEEADGNTVDELAFVGHRRGNIVGGHEDGTKH